MQLGSLGSSNYRFASEVRPTFANAYHSAAKNPLGIDIDNKNIVDKAASLKGVLEGVDLRNISSQELANLGTALYQAGEISDNAVINFIVGDSNLESRDTRFDAIAFFEGGFQLTKTNRDLSSSQSIYGDALNTLYNVDKVIKNITGANVNTTA